MRKPTVMLVDDLHWADQASVELLIHLLRLVESVPLMMLVAMRPHRQSPSWKLKQMAEADYPHRYTEIQLHPLSDGESASLINGLLAIADLPTHLQNLILAKTDGNPFFVEEVIRTLIERGDVVRDERGTHWRMGRDVAAISIPDNLQALLTARIDRLKGQDRATLQLAAVIGRQFYRRLLFEISQEREHLDRQLNTYQRVDLIREFSRDPELEYKFVHELTREAAYHSILRRERRIFHRRVARAIESLFAERLEEEAHRLAYHYDQAGLPDQARDYYRRAGDSAFRIFANAEAINHYSRAIALFPEQQTDDEALIYLYSKKGRAQELNGQHAQALQTYQELEQLGTEQHHPKLELTAILAQTTLYALPTSLVDLEKGRDLAERSLRLARRLGDRHGEAKALWNWMLLESRDDAGLEKALAHGRAAQAIAREFNFEEILAYSLHDLSRIYLEVGQFEQGMATANEAADLWRKLGNQPMLADNYSMRSLALYNQGKLDLALTTGQRALEISEEIGSTWGQVDSLDNLAIIYLDLGQIYRCILTLKRSVEIVEKSNFLPSWWAFGNAILAWSYGILGAPEMGFFYAERSHEFPPVLATILANLHHLNGDLAVAEAYYREVKEDLENILAMPHPSGHVLLGILGELALTLNDEDLLLRYIPQLLEVSNQRGSRVLIADLLHLQGKAELKLGHDLIAQRLFQAARDRATADNARRPLWSILVSLAEFAKSHNEHKDADRLLNEARDLLKFILEDIEDPDLRTSFQEQESVRQLLLY